MASQKMLLGCASESKNEDRQIQVSPKSSSQSAQKPKILEKVGKKTKKKTTSHKTRPCFPPFIPWPLRLEGKVAGAGVKRRKVAKDLRRKTGEKLDGNCTYVMWYY